MENIPDHSQLLRLAQSPEGKKLISLLQSADSQSLNTALHHAKAGNLEDAKNALSGILETPEAQALLRQLGR